MDPVILEKMDETIRQIYKAKISELIYSHVNAARNASFDALEKHDFDQFATCRAVQDGLETLYNDVMKNL